MSFAHQHHHNNNNKAETDAAVLTFGDEFKGAHALLNAEVLLLIEAYEKGRQSEPTLPYAGPNPVLQKVKEHVSTSTTAFKNRELIRDLRSTAIATYNLHEFEMAQVGNLTPEGVEEARMLVPSLGVARVPDEALQRLLDDVAVMKRLG